MYPVITPQQSRALDVACVERTGIDAYTLMETASRNAVDRLQTLLNGRTGLSILIGCGSGNNGGDGFAMARMLADHHNVTVLTDSDDVKMSAETKRNHTLASACARLIPWDDAADATAAEYDVVIDALVGVGMRFPLDALATARCNALDRCIAAMKIAVDVPTGLDPMTGHADTVFHADHTITMVAPKPGFYRNDGTSCVGHIHIVSIGAPENVVRSHTDHFVLEASDVRTWLPARGRRTSKFDYGRVLVVGGSRRMRGAPALTAHAALACGAGLVELASPALHPMVIPEVMTCEVAATDGGTLSAMALDTLRQCAERATVVAVGPGLGDDAEGLATVRAFLEGLDPSVPVVIDADATRVLPKLRRDMASLICTPHVGEFARMLESDRASTQVHSLERAQEMARRWGCVLHVKDVPSVSTDGRTTYLTVHGNPGMATAGSGDVLTGIIAGLAAQGCRPLEAAALGAYLHAAAGDVCATRQAMPTIIASDLIRALHDVF